LIRFHLRTNQDPAEEGDDEEEEDGPQLTRNEEPGLNDDRQDTDEKQIRGAGGDVVEHQTGP
jgi:hypothetical protein